jgi:hypothetical protein
MAAVIDPYTKEVLGIITLEDIIEELIQEEILDENDLADEYAKRAIELMEQARKLSRGLKQPATSLGPEKSPRVGHGYGYGYGDQSGSSSSSSSGQQNGYHPNHNQDEVELTVLDSQSPSTEEIETTINDKTHLMKNIS